EEHAHFHQSGRKSLTNEIRTAFTCLSLTLRKSASSLKSFRFSQIGWSRIEFKLEVSGRRHTLTTAFESPILIQEAMFPRRSPRPGVIFLTFVVAVPQGLTASV